MPDQVDSQVSSTLPIESQDQVPAVGGIPEDATFFTPNEPEEVFLTWEGPNRVYKKRTREYYTSIAIIVFLLSILAYFANQITAIFLIISVGFLSYVFAAIPPTQIEYKITSYGIHIGKKLYPWETLNRFWTTARFDNIVLHIEHTDPLFRRITLVIPNDAEEAIVGMLAIMLPNEEPEPTFIEKAGRWLEEKFPLERE